MNPNPNPNPNQHGRCVRVVLGELGLGLAVPQQIEAADKVAVAPRPALSHLVRGTGRGRISLGPALPHLVGIRVGIRVGVRVKG